MTAQEIKNLITNMLHDADLARRFEAGRLTEPDWELLKRKFTSWEFEQICNASRQIFEERILEPLCAKLGI